MEKAAIDELISKAQEHQKCYDQLVAEDKRIKQEVSDLTKRQAEIITLLSDIEEKHESVRNVLGDYNIDIKPIQSKPEPEKPIRFWE